MPSFPEYLPALVTPFTKRGEIDRDSQIHNVRDLADKGVEGFLIGGSTGEGPYLEPGDRSLLIKAIRRRKTHIMCGVAAESTRVAMALATEAEEAGADSLLVMTPTTMARGRDEAILNYYRTIAERVSIPVLIYSVPAITAYSIPLELVWRLSRHDNIVGMKDSSGDVVRLQSIVESTPADFILYSGASRALNGAVAVGCHGAITASGNYATDLVLRTLRTAKESPEKARRLQKRLSALSKDVEAHGVPGVKAAAKAAGLKPGFPREPLTRLSRGVETSIAKLIG